MPIACLCCSYSVSTSIILYLCSIKQSDFSLSSDDDFNKVKNHLENDRKLEVLQLQLDESQRSINKHLQDESYRKYAQLEKRFCNKTDNKMQAIVPINKQEQLQITVDYLLKCNQSSVEKYEMLKTYIDWINPNNVSANKPKNQTAGVVSQANITEQRQTINDDIYKEQELLKQVVNLSVEGSASPEKYGQLETLIDTLAESSVSRDYMDATLKNQAKKTLKELQQIHAAIKDIDTKNSAIEATNTELKVFVKGLKKSNSSNSNLDQLEEEIRKQQIIMKTLQDENNVYKKKFERIMTETTEKLNRNIVHIIHKLIAEQLP